MAAGSGALPKVLVVIYDKGGVGKTSMSRVHAEYMARSGRSVLMLDMDPQCNQSQRFLNMVPDQYNRLCPPLHPAYIDAAGPDKDRRFSTPDLLLGREVEPYPTGVPNLDLLPGYGMMLDPMTLMVDEGLNLRANEGVLRDFLWDEDVGEQYDLVIIDMPPSLSQMHQVCLKAATHALIPIVPEPQAVEGLTGTISMLNRENRDRAAQAQIQLVGVLANRVDMRQSIHQHYMKKLRTAPNISPYMLQAFVPEYTDVKNADVKPMDGPAMSLLDFPANSKIVQAIAAVCGEVEERLWGHRTDWEKIRNPLDHEVSSSEEKVGSEVTNLQTDPIINKATA